MAIAGHWNGHLYGTNTGNLAVSFEGDDAALTGLIRLSDNRYGVSLFDVEASFNSGSLALSGTLRGELPEGQEAGALTATGALTSEGRIDGEWSTSIGTGGTFQLWPHSYDTRRASSGIAPEQVNTSTIILGAVRLYADDVTTLISSILRDFTQERAVVTFSSGGSEKTVYSDEFERTLDGLSDLRYLKISVQELDLYNINKNAVIELSSWGENSIRVQSVQESWAIGKAEALSRQTASLQRALATRFRRFGLTINLVIFALALAATPGLPRFWQRLAFLGSAFAVQAAITYFHKQFVPNFLLFPARRRSGILQRLAPGVASWTITLIGGVAAAIIYGLLKGELNNTPITNFFDDFR